MGHTLYVRTCDFFVNFCLIFPPLPPHTPSAGSPHHLCLHYSLTFLPPSHPLSYPHPPSFPTLFKIPHLHSYPLPFFETHPFHSSLTQQVMRRLVEVGEEGPMPLGHLVARETKDAPQVILIGDLA